MIKGLSDKQFQLVLIVFHILDYNYIKWMAKYQAHHLSLKKVLTTQVVYPHNFFNEIQKYLRTISVILIQHARLIYHLVTINALIITLLL